MLKKLIKGIVVAGSVIVLAGSASAATYHVVGGGASAQGQFWRTAGQAYLNSIGCSNVVLDGETGDAQANAVMRGLTCTGVPGGTGNDTVYINYIEIASSAGCQNAPGSQPVTVADPSSCTWAGGGTCGTASFPMDVGCADVRCTSLDQTTAGYEDGRHGDYGKGNKSYTENCHNGDCDSSWMSFGTSDGYGWDTSVYTNMVVREGIVVPFGFSVNNKVTKTRCVEPTDPTGDAVHMAYSKWGWQCVPGAQACVNGTCEDGVTSCTQNTRYVMDTSGNIVLASGACPVDATRAAAGQSNDCVGYYKCDHGAYYSDNPDATVNDYTGYSKTGGECLDGNQGTSLAKTCTTPKDCKADIADTECMQQPIDNISRLQALLIFSGQVNNWKAFGPWYPDLPIVQCMRHAGSGTHATLDKAIFRGDRAMITETVAAAYVNDYMDWAGDPFLADWRECEVDGVCGTGVNTPHAAATNHTGEEATVWHYKSSTDLTYDCVDWYDGGIGYIDADKVLGNDDSSHSHTIKLEGVEPTREKVKFGEYVYWSAQQCQYDANVVPAVEQNIIEGLVAYAANPANLSNAAFGTSADWWATSGDEMRVKKISDIAYPQAK
ncbi:MAG: hypothetical protein SWH61_12325 [Thermodesulfobacteriota bacterium]|nr:hypothetical protein [Thermodesulfobacteriota bacterium]